MLSISDMCRVSPTHEYEDSTLWVSDTMDAGAVVSYNMADTKILNTLAERIVLLGSGQGKEGSPSKAAKRPEVLTIPHGTHAAANQSTSESCLALTYLCMIVNWAKDHILRISLCTAAKLIVASWSHTFGYHGEGRIVLFILRWIATTLVGFLPMPRA